MAKGHGEVGGQCSGGGGWPRFREAGGKGFRAMAKVPEKNGLYRVPSFDNQSVSRLKGKEVANKKLYNY